MRRGWDPVVLITWSLVALGLCISLWHLWVCSLRYLAQPVRVEDQFVPLTSLPPVQLSVCRRFSLAPEEEEFVPPADSSYYDVALPSSFQLPGGTITAFANSSAAFWQGLQARGESYRLSDSLAEIGVWNETGGGSWDVIYPRAGLKNDTSQFAMAFYPYEENSTLLCHTLQVKVYMYVKYKVCARQGIYIYEDILVCIGRNGFSSVGKREYQTCNLEGKIIRGTTKNKLKEKKKKKR
jgi:hypothetical protein